MKLITESNFDIITEEKEKHLYITGVFSSAEKKNQNGRIYPRKILEREIDKLQEGCKERTLIGELGHPTERAESCFKEAAILTEKLWWDGDNVMGRAKVLTTPNGFILRGLIEDKVKIGISSRGLGDVSENGIVKENLRLLTWDSVQNPSNYGSWVNGIYEDREFEVTTKELTEPTDKQIQEATKYHERTVWQVLKTLEKI